MSYIIADFLSLNLCWAILLLPVMAFEQYFVNLVPAGN